MYLLQVKKDSAKTEKAWAGAGSKVGKQIWRIVKFKVSEFNNNYCISLSLSLSCR